MNNTQRQYRSPDFAKLLFRALLLAVATAGAQLPEIACDWPQFRGPNRDGKSTEKTIP